MRILMLALFCFCCLSAGWTASLAQVRHAGTAAQQHHHQPGETAKAECCDRHGPRDGHSDAQVHPKLCPVCFAIETSGPGLSVRTPLSWRPHELPAAALAARMPKPLFPPPKA